MPLKKVWAAGDQALAADVNSNFTIANIFGGTGSDGALTISSGTTSISAASAVVLEKNYSSISITGTASLQFTTPNTNGTIITVKSSGNITITTSAVGIDASGMGAAGGPGDARSSNSNGTGTPGNPGWGRNFITNGGSGGIGGSPGTGGAGGVITSSTALFRTLSVYLPYFDLFVGAGGGGGGCNNGTGSCTAGAGGIGGGCLIIECQGSWNFTTANGISVAGKNGVNGASTGSASGSGGGGGGGGGFCLVLYNTLTASSGTVNVAGGIGGNGDNTAGTGNETGGGGGGSFVNAGNAGTNTTSDGAKTGGDGATGYSLVQLNTCYS